MTYDELSKSLTHLQRATLTYVVMNCSITIYRDRKFTGPLVLKNLVKHQLLTVADSSYGEGAQLSYTPTSWGKDIVQLSGDWGYAWMNEFWTNEQLSRA